MTTSPRFSTSLLAAGGALALVAFSACNAIFGIEEGLPLATTGSGGGGAAPAASSTGSAGSTATSSGAGNAGSTATSSSTGSGPACGADVGAATGTPRKLRSSGAEGQDQVNAVAHDPSGAVIAAGFFNGAKLTMGGPLAHQGTVDKQDGFIVKYDATDKYLWGEAFGGTSDVRFNGVAADAAGNVYATGAVYGAAAFGATNIDVKSDPTQPFDTYPDAVVVALDPDGVVKWAKAFGNPYVQRGLRIVADAGGNSYVAGMSYDLIDFGDGSGPIGDPGDWWSFFLKLDPSGKPVWAKSFGGFDSDLTPDYQEFFEATIALDGKGRVLVGGNFKGQIFFGNDQEPALGGTDAFVAALSDADGTMIWHQTMHRKLNAGPDPDGDQWITALTVDPCSGDVYAAGCYTQGIDFGALGSAKVTTGLVTDPDMFVVKLDAADGAPRWFHAYGDAGRQEPTSIAVGPDGSVHVAGFLLDAVGYTGVNFGSPIGVLGTAQPEPGSDYYPDAFLIKLDAAGVGLWGKRLGDLAGQEGDALAVDAHGSIVLGGIMDGTLALGGAVPPFSAAGYDAFLARFDP